MKFYKKLLVQINEILVQINEILVYKLIHLLLSMLNSFKLILHSIQIQN